MPRNSEFPSGRDPLGDHPHLTLKKGHVAGPFSFLNPTSARYQPSQPDAKVAEEAPPAKIAGASATKPAHVERLWRSRDNRKGRHALRVDYRVSPDETGYTAPKSTATFKAVVRGILRMVTYFPYWDVSWLVATSFTLGSVIWIINAFFAWLPLVDPQTEFSNETLFGGGITAFIGATVFEIGSVLLLLEAINANQTSCFGWALETVMQQVEGDTHKHMTEVKPSVDACLHHHANRKSFLGVDRQARSQAAYVTTSPDGRSFRWVPSMSELRTHYFHELGFLASLTQFLAATIFWIAGFTSLPGINNNMSQGLTDGVYWVPQIVGGLGFVLSGLLFTLETQAKWWKPAPHVLGWHIGAWNFIGGIGFTLCGALGPATSSSSGVLYQSCLATFWGSWAFMIGSTLQWYESLEKHPVEKQ
ncbi:hypothetical protein N7474_001631 [Penicillium riverlandense]|uniref:uncharacterized protein n=1 Tax=Penicillium riverlandense TaxID=1903569 RepID=UPI0025475C72|nr:uncharacterized protein N7474_001631 [Penicillium riverlandense]KAJ5833320.1 hypothetical protein N7474_001631 [Penicillium riverlandense]